MTQMIEAIIIGALLVFMAWREWQHDRERKDLYSRIMARDLSDYAITTQVRPPPKSRNFITAGLRRYFKWQEEAGD